MHAFLPGSLNVYTMVEGAAVVVVAVVVHTVVPVVAVVAVVVVGRALTLNAMSMTMPVCTFADMLSPSWRREGRHPLESCVHGYDWEAQHGSSYMYAYAVLPVPVPH